MAIRDRLLDLEQRLKQLAGESSPREPLEVRQAILQAVEDITAPAGRGRRVMPFDRVDIDVLAPSADLRRVFEAVFARDGGIDASVRQVLAGVRCEPGPGFTVAVTYRRRPPATWIPDQRFAVRGRVDAASPAPAPTSRATSPPREPAAPTPAAARGDRPPPVVLELVKGRAARRTIELCADRINIGRQDEVTDRDRRLVRRNHVVFVEGDEISATVSRAHAHIRWVAPGEFRVRDDNSALGTRIVREGRTIDVPAGSSRGVRLQDGDELHVGRAIVRFAIGPVPAAPAGDS